MSSILRVTGDNINFDRVQELSNLKPYKLFKKGDQKVKGKVGPVWKTDGFFVEITSAGSTIEVIEQIKHFLKNNKSDLAELRKIISGSPILDVEIKKDEAMFVQNLYIDIELMGLLIESNINFNVSVY